MLLSMNIGAKMSELFCNMTEFAMEACKTAHNTMQVLCDRVTAGVVTLNEIKFLKRNKGKVHRLCAAACMEFSFQKWLGHLEDLLKDT